MKYKYVILIILNLIHLRYPTDQLITNAELVNDLNQMFR